MSGLYTDASKNRMKKDLMRLSRLQISGLLFLLLLSASCKKSDSGSSGPASTPTVPAAPVAAATPPPSFSAAQKIGMFAYAKNNQSNDQ